MRKFHQNVILFGIVLTLVIMVIDVLLKNNTKTHIDLKYDEIYKPKIKADIIFLGNSHAAHSINPKYIKLQNHTTFNFAFNGCTPQYYKKWYNLVLKENYPKPKYVVYAVDWAMFDNTKSERNFGIDIRLMPWSVFLHELIYDQDIGKKSLISNRFTILFKPKQLQYVFYKKKKGDFVDLDAYFQGYVPHVTNHVIMGKSPEQLTVSKDWKNDFNELISDLKRDSIQVIFVNVPEYIPSWNTNDINKRFNYLDSVAKVNNIPYLRYNQDQVSEMNYDSTYFNNWIHLNDRGARKFSEMLSTDLQKLIH